MPKRTFEFGDKGLAAIVLIGSGLASALYAAELLAALYRPWNDARLAPSAAILRGFDLYAPAVDPGPIWSFIYGPIGPLVYLPPAMMPTPLSAIAVGLVWSVALVLLPASWLLSRTTRATGWPLRLGLLGFALYCLFETALGAATFWIHVDAPTLAFCALATGLLVPPTRVERVAWAPSDARLAVAAILAAAAVFTKQVAIPLGPGLALALVLSGDRRSALRFSTYWFAAGLAGAVLVAATADWDAFIFNVWTLPAQHPWKWGGGLEALLISSLEFLGLVLPLVGLLVFDALALRGRPPREWLSQPRAFVLVVALALAATSIGARVKVGAEINAQAYTLLFFAIAGVGALIDAASSVGPRALVARVFAVGLVVGLVLHPLGTLTSISKAIEQLPIHPARTAFDHALREPGGTYFPQHPLVTLMAEDRGTHVSYGIYDRALAGRPVSDSALRAHTAADLKHVAVWGPPHDSILLRLPEFTQRLRKRGMPGWTFWSRAPRTR